MACACAVLLSLSAAGTAAQTALPGWSWEHVLVDDTRVARAFGMAMGDATGDGLPDIASGRYFYRNPGGDLTAAWPRAVFPGAVDAVAVFDVDGDVFGDVFAVNCDGAYWLEARDAAGSAWDTTRVSNTYACDHSMSSQGYVAAQLSEGGCPEVVVATHHSGVVCFSVPGDPMQFPWPSVSLTSAYTEGIAVADVDGDGEPDVCGGGQGSSAPVWWLENPGVIGDGGWERHDVGVLTADLDRIRAIDIDNDGRMDIVATEEATTTGLYWFRQTSSGWERHLVATGSRYLSLDAADIDGDGDGDIITGEEVGEMRIQLWVYEEGTRFGSVTVDNVTTHIGCLLVDLDRDGDLDIASNSWAEPEKLHVWRTDRPAATVVPTPAACLRPFACAAAGAWSLAGRALDSPCPACVFLCVEGAGQCSAPGGHRERQEVLP